MYDSLFDLANFCMNHSCWRNSVQYFWLAVSLSLVVALFPALNLELKPINLIALDRLI